MGPGGVGRAFFVVLEIIVVRNFVVAFAVKRKSLQNVLIDVVGFGNTGLARNKRYPNVFFALFAAGQQLTDETDVATA